jgi:hypothetical protein
MFAIRELLLFHSMPNRTTNLNLVNNRPISLARTEGRSSRLVSYGVGDTHAPHTELICLISL